MKKIALLTADIGTETGRGIAIYTQELSEGLKKLGINNDIINFRKGSLRDLIKIIPLLRDYEVIHIQHEYNLYGSFAGVKFIPFLFLLFFLTHSRLIITMHTIHGKKEKLIHKSKLWLFLRSHIVYPLENRIIGKLSDVLIAHTDFLAKRLISDYKIPKKKVRVIPHAVNIGVPIISKGRAKRELGIKGPLYLMMGNITYQKGFDRILKKAASIKGNIIVFGQGDKTYIDYLSQLASLSKNSKIDTIVDSVDSDYKKWWLYLSAADLILLPYRSMTTSGIFITAMQAAKPVITSDTLYFREVLSKYNCLKLVEQDSDFPIKIKEIMNPKIYLKMSLEAKRFAKENSLGHLSNRYRRIYGLG